MSSGGPDCLEGPEQTQTAGWPGLLTGSLLSYPFLQRCSLVTVCSDHARPGAGEGRF